MKLLGYIKFQKRVKVGTSECYGCTRARGSTFNVRISRDAAESYPLFVETIFHELIHLGFFVIMACAKIYISERQQHIIMRRAMRVLLKDFRRHNIRLFQ